MEKFSDIHKNFIDNLKKQGKATATVVAYSKDIQQLLSHVENLGKGEINSVKKEDLDHFLETLKNTNYTPKSISRKINATRTFFKFLYEEAVIVNDPSRQITHPKIDSKKPRIFSKMEYGALRDVAKADARAFAMIEILLQTGIRISELANIRLSHITFSEKDEPGKLYVPNVETKIERTIPLNAAAQKAVKSYLTARPKTKKDFVFITKTGNPVLIRNIRAMIDRLFRSAGIEKAKVNDLRHTFVVHHLRMGVNIAHLSKIAGHKRLSTTEKYLEFVEEKVSSSEKLELTEL